MEFIESEDPKQRVKVRRASERTKLCSYCGRTYSTQGCKRHDERVHRRLKNFHVSCTNWHSLDCYNKLNISNQCDYCDYKSYSRNHIEIHLRSHLKIKNHYCDQCGASFVSSYILRQHFLTHVNDRPFICEYENCSMSFKSVYALRRHSKTHSDDKWRFECDVCGAKFTDNWHLKRHQNAHTSQPHPCEVCGKVFGTDDRLKAHAIYHRAPQFQCKICTKPFFKKPDLTTHLRIHSGQKDFQCSFCPNSYFKSAHLNRHMKSHIKSEIYLSESTIEECEDEKIWIC